MNAPFIPDVEGFTPLRTTTRMPISALVVAFCLGVPATVPLIAMSSAPTFRCAFNIAER